MEVRGLGRSLWPLVRSGDRVLVEAVEPAGLRAGQLVVAWVRSQEVLVCHLLIGTSPVQTAPIFGVEDGEVEVLARVVRIQGFPEAMDRLLRSPHAVIALRRFGRAARRRGWTTKGRERLEAVLGARFTVGVRRTLLGPFLFRRLSSEDLEDLAIFTGHYLSWMSATWLEAQLSGSWEKGASGAFAAFDRQDRIRAFGYLGRYTDEGVNVPGVWLRSLYVAPIARGLGLGSRLIEERLALAEAQGFDEVYSDIYRGNSRSLQLHLKRGFVEVPPEGLAPFRPLLERGERRGRELLILRWRSGAHRVP